MPQLKCAECGEPFAPREAKQRFCSPACRIAWFANERREAVRRYRSEMPSSYFEMEAGRDDESSGPAVTGASPVYGANLPAPAWSKALASLPKERPLGERVDAVNDISAVWFDPEYVAPTVES
ncbi:recombination protein NinG [Bradyrhizobium sp. NBAIM01]|uniref:recombination protein NinG n=1 Tax=Bradyrhizobium sp. NBAIM01 TaxID=2793818 RepID=UPI001CD7BED7|nr:recombination protein NinG [Bradyrhizobium sp. NBAIM01]MCA1513638.1 hypothetical protein [Bradyrhizobium sp. NBAIM01]